jgi:hypothetical protein
MNAQKFCPYKKEDKREEDIMSTNRSKKQQEDFDKISEFSTKNVKISNKI